MNKVDYQSFENKNVLLAVSTGVDSMVLLHKMMQINCNIFVVYVRHHHRIRVHIENEFFTQFCKDNNLNLTTYDYYHIDGNFESVARTYRYKCFKEVYDRHECDYLLTAHHGDDLVETMLMRQLRGTDINSVGGIREFSFRFGMNIARPLLMYSKFDIREYAKKYCLIYFEDETNTDISYKRNFLRHEIIPKLGQGYVKKYNNLSKELYELSDYINDVVNSAITVYSDIYLDVSSLDKRIYKYGIKNCLKHLYKDDIKVIYDKHVNLIELMKNQEKLQLPHNYYVFYKDNTYIFSKCQSEKYSYTYEKGLEVKFLNSKIVFEGDSVIRLSDEVVFPLRVENASLDYYIENNNGKQKLNRVFINAKIARHKREGWPVLLDATDKVICVFGIKYSKYCLSDANEYKCMIQYKCEFKGDDYSA